MTKIFIMLLVLANSATAAQSIASATKSLPLSVPAQKKLAHPIDEKPTKDEGPYRDVVLKAISTWPQAKLHLNPTDAEPLKMIAYESPQSKHAIGIGQQMLVNAAAIVVRNVLTDYKNYKELFFTTDDVKLIEQDGNRAQIAWEQGVPIPFVPATKYKTYFYEDSTNPDLIFFRYQLKESDDLIYSDGFMVIEKIDATKCLFTEYDFFDAHWGIAAKLGPKKIWEDSIRDTYYSDMAIKFKAENPDWTYDKIKEESEKHYKEHPLGDILDKKTAFKVK